MKVYPAILLALLLFFTLQNAVKVKDNFMNIGNIGVENTRNKGVIGHVFNKTGILICARQCERIQHCSSFNFMKALFLCEIIVQELRKTEYAEGWKHVSNISWLTGTAMSTEARGTGCVSPIGQNIRLTTGIMHCVSPKFPIDCGDDFFIPPEAKSGIYFLHLTHITKAHCDMETDGGGWTVFQSRKDGSEDFFRNWADYKRGFGDVSGEFWMGNLNLHHMLSQFNYSLRIDMEGYDGAVTYAKYSKFLIDTEQEKFRITVTGFHGNTENGFGATTGYSFSTFDRDNDIHVTSCSMSFRGGWWYGKCHICNLNGLYGNFNTAESIIWHLPTAKKSLKTVSMKIKRDG